MGSCLSKKNTCSSFSSPPITVPEKIKFETHFEKKKIEEENPVKKEIFIIKHRKSHEIDSARPEDEIKKTSPETFEKGKGITFTSTNNNGVTGAAVRTSSCTKEEVDAILIQCGRLSRSSSTGKAAESGGKKYSGSKRSYDFDNDGKNVGDVEVDDSVVGKERENRHRHRQSPSHVRRRTPSREREREQQQQRSGSRERSGSGSGGRRMSRSPAKRSESPNSNLRSNSNSSRPGKMVSVPATISSMNGGGGEANSGVGVKRIQVKRNVGGGDGGTTRTTASPRARSPARMRGSNEQQQQQPMSLSRSNSRKAEHSPYRRNPLSEIDTNIISQAPPLHKPNAETKINSNTTNVNHNTKEQQQKLMTEENNKGSNNVAGINLISTGPESLKPHTITRSRSSRLSRDLEELIINSETPLNSNNSSSSYTALLLEDIQNFHQKNTTTTTTSTPPSFSFPPCLTKACSILNAVADLNSTTSSENRLRNPSRPEIKDDQYLESEIVAEDDDFTKQSFHKYVTVRRGTIGGEEFEEQESEGSNSFVGSQQQWISPLWEAKSVDSTDRWTSSSSRSVSRGNDLSSEDLMSESKSGKRSSVMRGNSDNQLNGIGRGRVGVRGGTSMATTVSN